MALPTVITNVGQFLKRSLVKTKADRQQFVSEYEAFTDDLNPMIDGINENVNWIDDRVSEVDINTTIAKNSSDNAQIARDSIITNYVGDWVAGEYLKGVQVSYQDGLYIAKRDTSNPPTFNETSDDWLFTVRLGSANPINSVLPLNYDGDLMFDVGGVTWLKSGVKIDNTDYPSATGTIAPNIDNTTKELTTLSNTVVNPILFRIGDFRYYIEYLTNLVVQMDLLYVPTGTTYTITEVAEIDSVLYDWTDGVVWLMSADQTFKFDTSFVYQNAVFTRTIPTGSLSFLPNPTDALSFAYMDGYYYSRNGTSGNGLVKYDKNWNVIQPNVGDIYHPYITQIDDNTLYITTGGGYSSTAGQIIKSLNGIASVSTEELKIPIMNKFWSTSYNEFLFDGIFHTKRIFKCNLDGSWTGESFPITNFFVDLTIREDIIYVLQKTGDPSSSMSGTYSVEKYDMQFNLLDTIAETPTMKNGMVICWDPITDTILMGGNLSFIKEVSFNDPFTLTEVVPNPTRPNILPCFSRDINPYNSPLDITLVVVGNKIYSTGIIASELSTLFEFNLSDFASTGVAETLNNNNGSSSVGAITNRDNTTGVHNSKILEIDLQNSRYVTYDYDFSNKIIGIPASTDTDTGLPNYLRIK